MHELAIAQQVVRAVLAEMDRRGASAVRSIDLEVGQLEGLGADELCKAFEVESAGTALEGTVLNVSVAPAKAHCPACGTAKKFELPAGHRTDMPTIACPDCGADLDLEGGRGIVVKSAAMVLEDP